MRIRMLATALMLLMSSPAWAGAKIDLNNDDGTHSELGGVGDAAKASLSTLLAGEDQLNNIMRIERQPLRSVVTADTLVLTGAGRLSSMICWGSDAAATAGTIDVLDSTSAGAGTKVLSFPIAASLLLPVPISGVDIPFTTGLYVDFTTTNDVSCTVLYRAEATP